MQKLQQYTKVDIGLVYFFNTTKNSHFANTNNPPNKNPGFTFNHMIILREQWDQIVDVPNVVS